MNTTTTKRPRRPAGQRAKPVSATCEGAFEDGKSAVESLKEEIEEWKNSLESNSMEHLPKYDEVSECCDALESGLDTLEGISFPGCLSDLFVSYTEDTRQEAQSRRGRMGNALGALEAAKSEAECWLENNGELELVSRPEDEEDAEGWEPGEGETEDQQEVDDRDSERSEVEEFVSSMDDAISELEGADFPGMY